MRFGVLASPESWYVADLRRAADDRHEIVPLSFRDLAAAVTNDGARIHSHRLPDTGAIELDSFAAILIRTMPPGSLEQIVFRMDVLAILESRGALLVNPPKAIEVAVDKFLALARLAAAGLRVPRTFVCQTATEGLAAFEQLQGDAVLKPLFGSEGRGITRIADRPFAERALRLLAERGEVLYLQEFIAHPGHDVRVLLIGEKAFALRRSNLLDWRTNLSLGGTAERIEPTDEMVALARRAAAAAGAPLAGVDLIQDAEENWYVLEVNAVPGWKATAAALDVDIAADVLAYLARVAQSRQAR